MSMQWLDEVSPFAALDIYGTVITLAMELFFLEMAESGIRVATNRINWHGINLFYLIQVIFHWQNTYYQ